MRNILAALFFSSLMVIAMPSDSDEKLEYIEYELKKCIDNNSFSSFLFETKNKESRHFTINTDEMIVEFSFSGGKGSVKWNSIKKITYLKLDNNRGYLKFLFIGKQMFYPFKKLESIEFGVIDINCWDFLVSRVDSQVHTDIINR